MVAHALPSAWLLACAWAAAAATAAAEGLGTEELAPGCGAEGQGLSLLQTSARAHVAPQPPRVRRTLRRKPSAAAAHQAASLLDLAAARKRKQRSDIVERIWLLCTGPPPPVPSEAEEDLELEPVAQMWCTQEYTYEELCCLNYDYLQFSNEAAIVLEAAQVGGMYLDAYADSSSEVVILCTEPSTQIAEEAAQNVTSAIPLECIRREFTMSEIQGVAIGQLPGAVVLQERMRYLTRAGVNPYDLQTCTDILGSPVCPSGAYPTAVTEDFRDTLNASSPAELERVWMVCRGPPFATLTEEELAMEEDLVNSMSCTDEYAFEELCCLDYAALEFPHAGAVSLASAQRGALGVDPNATSPGEAVVICTEQRAEIGPEEELGRSVNVPMECFNLAFTLDEIQGTAGGYTPGQLILEERIRYLVAQGVPGMDIATCTASIGFCPSGLPTASAGYGVLQDLLSLRQEEETAPFSLAA